MNWKRLALPVLAALLLVPHVSTAAPKKTFVMVPKGVHPYYEPCYEGFKAAAKKYDVNVDKVDPQKFELPLQVKAIEELIAQRVDGIAISALDDAGLVPVITEATRAGIKVITFDAPAPSSQALTYIGTDNKTAGFDDLKDTLQGIRDGTVAFCIVQKTFKMGWLSVEALLDASKGKTLPKVTDTGVLFVTKSNVDTYMAEMKKEFTTM